MLTKSRISTAKATDISASLLLDFCMGELLLAGNLSLPPGKCKPELSFFIFSSYEANAECFITERQQGSGVCGAGVEIDAARAGNCPCRPDGDAARRDRSGAFAAVSTGVVLGAEEVDRHGVT